MTDIEYKATWFGQDIDELPREELIKIIHALGRQLEQARWSFQSVNRINRLARERSWK